MTQRKAPEPLEPIQPAAPPAVPVAADPAPAELAASEPAPIAAPAVVLPPVVPAVSPGPVGVPVLAFDQPTAAYQVIPGDAVDPSVADVHRIAGDVAVDVAHQLAEPVRALRERLGLVVDHLERHVATATGPTPYPWRSLQTLRQDLAAAYLEATTLARRLDELDRALADHPPGWFDVAPAVDLGLHLAAHHLAAGIELLIDLGNTPPARGTPGTLALLVAQLVAASARSAHDLPGSTISVRVAPEASWALITVADNGAGSPRAIALGDLARGILAPWGGTVDATSVSGAGCAFELRLATAGE